MRTHIRVDGSCTRTAEITGSWTWIWYGRIVIDNNPAKMLTGYYHPGEKRRPRGIRPRRRWIDYLNSRRCGRGC